MNPAYELMAGVRGGQYHKGELIEAAEELARWLFQALLMAIPEIDADRLRSLLARQQSHRISYNLTLVSMLLNGEAVSSRRDRAYPG